MSPKLLTDCLSGSAIARPASFLLLLICAALTSTAQDPAPLITVLPFAVLLIGAFLGGAISARKHGEDGILCGLVCGVVYALVIFVIRLFVGSEGFLFALFFSALTVAFSALGGYCFRHRTPSAKKRRAALLKLARSR